MKSITICLIVLSLILIALLVVNKCTGARVITLDKIDKKEAHKLMGVYRINFPATLVFEKVAILGGKDWILFSKVKINSSEVKLFKESILYETRIIKSQHATLIHPAISWWKIDESNVQVILRDVQSYTDIIILNPVNSEVSIMMRTDGGPSGFPEDIWELFGGKERVRS